MIRQIGKIFSYAAAAAMALLIGVGSCTSDVSAKDADGNIVIVIDPGHGGTDPGKQGINGVLESDANYAIAEAMMDELKNYSGVKVYFTRPEDSLVTLTGRAMAAAELDADFLISIHNNSTSDESISANGAMVLTSVLPLYSTITADMGNYILNNLAQLGIKNNGIQTRSSTEYVGEDYHTIMAEGMRAGVPTIIVEHCFLSSTTDVLFVSDENGMVDYEKTAAIGKSDAEAVATYFNLERRVLQAGQTGELELEKGYSARLETSGDAVWTSNNESCVTVDEYGNIKAVGSGSAVLSYTASDGTAGVVNVKVDIPEQIAITGFIDPTFYKTKEKFSEIDLSTVKAVIAYSDGSVIQVIPEKVGEVDYNKPGIQDIPISYGALKGFVRVVNQTEDYIPEVTSKEPETETQTAEPETTTQKAKENLKIYIEAAKARGESLDHVLFYGPPGLGKTTLAGIIANEMGTHMKVTSGPAIGKPGEMAAILSNLQEGDVLFVDEIHRLNRQVEEVLYPAMEDYAIDIMLGKGATARSIRLDLPKFTLVGATTRAGLLSAPLRDRFGVVHHLEFYTVEELKTIILHSALTLGVEIDEEGAYEMARRSRGTPRLANRLLKRVRDFAQVKYDGRISKEVASFALDLLEVDKMGLDQNDRNILMTMIGKFAGGPVGLDTLAAAIGEDAGTIEDVYEPYLVKNGLINRTPKGRVVTELAYQHLGIEHSV